MIDLAGMHSYFWLTSSRLRKPLQDDVPYTTQALKHDLSRVRIAWEDCQSSRDRNAIYGYISAVFDLLMWWKAEDRVVSRARWALRLNRKDLTNDEPFAAVILCTSDPSKVDKRRDPSGRACCDTRRSTSQLLSRLRRSFSARVASTNVLSDLRVVLGEAVNTKRLNCVMCSSRREKIAEIWPRRVPDLHATAGQPVVREMQRREQRRLVAGV